MATRPTNDLLIWANTDVNLPNLAGPNKTEPSTDLVAKGWDFKQKPSADEFNYILNNLSEWVKYLKTLTAEGTPLNTPSTLVKRDASGNFAASMVTSNLTGNVTGNSDTSSKWQTARTLNVSGAVIGSVSIDGSGNIPLTLSAGSGVQRYITKTVVLSTTIRNGSVTVSLPTTLFGGNTPSFVTFSATAYSSSTVADLYGYGLNAGISQNQATMLMACGSDDTDQGTGIIRAASSFVLPYNASQDFYIYADGGYSFTCTTTIYVTGYQI